jgi:integrase/recombinase XerD
MKTQITFTQAIDGYLLAANARRLSQHTLLDYINTYRRFLDFLQEDPPIEEISAGQVEAFLASRPVSKKTVLNYHTGLSALWTWAVAEEVVKEQVVRKVQLARPEKRSILPYTEADVRAMLSMVTTSRLYRRPGKRESSHSVLHPERNRAIILVLLDTGLRATELCELQVNQVDLRNRRLTVMGKGTKERTLPFSARTGQALWKYLAIRKEVSGGDRLFVTKDGRPIDRDQLLKSLRVLGQRSGVNEVNVHRFRHTFAINYLRNGGDPYSLQMMLGHSTMEMVKTYLALAQADLEKNHKIASPVDHWRL